MNLPRGRDAAVTLSQLAEQTGLSRREVEEGIRQMRLAGHPICTGPEGVWRAETAQEAREMAQRLRSRAVHQLETAHALQRAADAMSLEQTTIWEAA